MHRQTVLLVASLLFCGISWTAADHFAVLVAGSNEYYNYRHQADVCHAYQILHKYGIPDSNIVVMMYDDIANNAQNPTKGVLINRPGGSDVYKGVPKDYVGEHVTPKNFMNVLLGKKDALKGIGSGKVLESGPDDNVFIFYSDHGAVDLVAFPAGGYLYAKDLNATITKMHEDKKYKQMAIYIEACESGSMLEDYLSKNINIYGTTASNAEESSYACYYDATRQTYLGDLYSVNWMEDSDVAQMDKETLFQQFNSVKAKTNLSHVMQYGDLTLGQAQVLLDFQGETKEFNSAPRNFLQERYNDFLKRDAVATVDVRLSIVSRRLAAADENSAEKQALERELFQLLNDRSTITNKFHRIAATALASNGGEQYGKVIEKHMKLTQHDCYMSVTDHVHQNCFDITNDYALNKLYIMGNLCQVGLPEFTIKQAVNEVCQERLSFDY